MLRVRDRTLKNGFLVLGIIVHERENNRQLFLLFNDEDARFCGTTGQLDKINYENELNVATGGKGFRRLEIPQKYFNPLNRFLLFIIFNTRPIVYDFLKFPDQSRTRKVWSQITTLYWVHTSTDGRYEIQEKTTANFFVFGGSTGFGT